MKQAGSRVEALDWDKKRFLQVQDTILRRISASHLPDPQGVEYWRLVLDLDDCFETFHWYNA